MVWHQARHRVRQYSPAAPPDAFYRAGRRGAPRARFFCTRANVSIAAAVGCGGATLIMLSDNAPPHRPANRACFGGTSGHKPERGATRLQGAASGRYGGGLARGLGGLLTIA